MGCAEPKEGKLNNTARYFKFNGVVFKLQRLFPQRAYTRIHPHGKCNCKQHVIHILNTLDGDTHSYNDVYALVSTLQIKKKKNVELFHIKSVQHVICL